MSRRIVFLGTPTFALPILEVLADRKDVDVVLVVTQPDRPSGRGRKELASPIKIAAIERGLQIYQTATLKDAGSRSPIVDAKPDLIVVAAFGVILGRSVLELPRAGCVNVHASLLPRYRGANPIAAAILNGDQTTGVSLMWMERGLDTGPVYARQSTDITSGDTTETLADRLSHIGARVLDTHLSSLLSGTAVSEEQGVGATCTRPMIKDDGWIDWTRPAKDIERQIRAMWPWPRAWTTLPEGSRVQILEAGVLPRQTVASAPGTVLGDRRTISVQCGDGSLRLDRIQIAGGRAGPGLNLGSRIATTAAIRLGQIGVPIAPGPLVRDCYHG